MKKTATLMAAGLITVTAGCGGRDPAAEAPPSTALSGTAYLAGGPAPGTKTTLAHVGLRFSRGGKLVRQVSANAAGGYAVTLPPGDYDVLPMTASCPGPLRVMVPSAPAATADIVCPIP